MMSTFNTPIKIITKKNKHTPINVLLANRFLKEINFVDSLDRQIILVVKWFFRIGNTPRSFSYELAIGIPQQLQVATLPYLMASSAKFLRSAFPKDGTSIMLCGWVQALM